LEDEARSRDKIVLKEIVRSVPDSYISHPWLRLAEALPRGMAEHILEIIALQEYHVRLGFGLERDAVFPLFCQPIVEFALQTPTYVLGNGGVDRAVERQAFRDVIPESVFRRTSKGGVAHTGMKQLGANMDFFRDLALGGELAARGWIDRTKAERMLKDEYVVSGRGAMFIYDIVVAETWLKQWRTNGMRAAA
jgi:asparagine synthase (glutamine-hydrolysing)